MTDTNSAKRELRDIVRARLAGTSESQRAIMSASVCARLSPLDAIERSGAIMVYGPMPGEVDLTALAEACCLAGRTVCIPDIDWDTSAMEPCVVRSLGDDDLEAGRYGVPVPRRPEVFDVNRLDVVIVPGLGFDRDRRRLGRGGGYYDRFLPRARRAVTIGVAFDLQVLETVPADDHDVPLDLVVTESRVLT